MINLGSVKVVKCVECGVDVKINAAYPINSVSCQPYYCPKNKPLKNDKNV